MVICKYFLEGRCRFGDRCFNEHVIGGNRYQERQRYESSARYQQNQRYEAPPRYPERQRYESPPRYSDHQRYQSPVRYQDQQQYDSSSHRYDSRQNRGSPNYNFENRGYNNRYERNDFSSTNPYSWLSDDYKKQSNPVSSNRSRYDSLYMSFEDQSNVSFSPPKNKYQEPGYHNEVFRDGGSKNYGIEEKHLETLQFDATHSKEGKQWPFSCYQPFKGYVPFPEFEDLSPEELRCKAYEAERTNTFQAYVRAYNEALEEANQRWEMLKNPKQNTNVLNAVKKILSEKLNLEMESPKKPTFLGQFSDSMSSSAQSAGPASSFFSGKSSSNSGNVFTLSHLASGGAGNASSVFGRPVSDPNSSVAEMDSMNIDPGVSRPFGTSTPNKFETQSRDKSSALANGTTGSEVYSNVEELSKEELDAFAAARFAAGKIPTRPPPQSMCF